MHPLVNNIGDLKDAELETKIQDLSKRYFMAARNPALQQQVWAVLESYKSELAVRRSKFWDELNQKRDSDLDNLINVN
jgi:hypothetical protein